MHAQHQPEARTCSYVVRSEVNGRDNNEDSFHVYQLQHDTDAPPLWILALADGMGGHEHGEVVSYEALRKASLVLFESLCVTPVLNQPTREPLTAETVADVLYSVLEQTNAHVRRMVQTNHWSTAGSTLVLAAVLGDTCIVANLGDSPLWHYQAATDQLHRITDDHTVAGVLLRAGVITPEMARYHEGRSRLEFYLGAEKLPREKPLYRVPLAPGDRLLLCSDGVSGQLALEDVQACISAPSGDLARLADLLLAASTAAGETDNQTLILWQYGTPPTNGRAETPTVHVQEDHKPPLTTVAGGHESDVAVAEVTDNGVPDAVPEPTADADRLPDSGGPHESKAWLKVASLFRPRTARVPGGAADPTGGTMQEGTP